MKWKVILAVLKSPHVLWNWKRVEGLLSDCHLKRKRTFFFALIHLKRFSTQARSSSLSLTNITEKILSKNGHCCPFWPFKALVIVFLILHTPQMKNEKRPTPFLTRCRLGSKLAKNSASTKFVLKMYKKEM